MNSKASLESIDRAVKQGDSAWHLLIVLIQHFEMMNPVLQEKDFETICKNAQYIITTCYDGEDYLF